MDDQLKVLAEAIRKMEKTDQRFLMVGVLDLMEAMVDRIKKLEDDNRRLRESFAKGLAGGGRAIGGSNDGFSIG